MTKSERILLFAVVFNLICSIIVILARALS